MGRTILYLLSSASSDEQILSAIVISHASLDAGIVKIFKGHIWLAILLLSCSVIWKSRTAFSAAIFG